MSRAETATRCVASGRGSKQRQQMQRVETAAAKRRTLVVVAAEDAAAALCLGTLASDTAYQLNIFRHYGYAASMDGRKVGFLTRVPSKSQRYITMP